MTGAVPRREGQVSSPGPQSSALSRRAAAGWGVLAAIIAAAIGTGVAMHHSTALPGRDPARRVERAAGGTGPAPGPRVCGQPTLNSPYHYDGPAGPYRSGTPGLPTFGTPGSDFPDDTAGRAVSAGPNEFLSWQLKPDTVYYLLPGTHVGSFQANTNDAFVGGLSHGIGSILSGNYSRRGYAFDSNSTNGNQADVTIEYLTIEKYSPVANAAAINLEANTGWTIQHNTITLNVPGAGVILGADSTLKYNCLTQNGQYGFQSTDVNGFGVDARTGGPFNVTISGNEVSNNDTCDFEGRLSNPAIGWSHHDPVPPRYRNPHCGRVTGDGNQGGFKLWRTDGVTVTHNYIHGNWGPGIWVDTGNANTTITDNAITDNAAAAIIEEISYNFSISHNFLARNNWLAGLDNYAFPSPAIYISESGSDMTFGGVPACPEKSCARQRSYQAQSLVSDNTLINNGGGIFLWQNSNRYCSDGFDDICTFVRAAKSGPFTIAGCRANLPSADVSTTTFAGKVTGSPAADWWDGCQWKTEKVRITGNEIYFDPRQIPDCDPEAWPACGANGIFSEYGSPASGRPGWLTATQLTFFQGNIWTDNVYRGPSSFYAWNQGNSDNPVSWAKWAGRLAAGGMCMTPGDRHSGSCSGPFGQDAGSTYDPRPVRRG